MLDLFEKYSKEFELQTGLLEVLAKEISKGDQYYFSYRKYYKKINLYLKRPIGMDNETEFIFQKSKLGVMAIYGYEVRNLGFEGWYGSLFTPDISIQYAAKYLKSLLLKYDLPTTISTYNFGSPMMFSGHYPDQELVFNILNKLKL